MRPSSAHQRARSAGIVALLIATALLPLPHAAAQATDEPRQETVWHEATTFAPTTILFPADFDAAEPHTLVVALHGYGSSARAFRRVAEVLIAQGFVVAVPEAPYALLVENGLGFDWTLHHVDDDELSNRATPPLMREYLPAVARDIAERYPIDRAYTLGFSQGAVLALGTAVFNPELFDGAVSFGLPAFSPEWVSPAALAAGRDVGMLLIHGDADELAPFAASEAARAYFATADYDVTLKPFRGGHTVPDEQLMIAVRWMRGR